MKSERANRSRPAGAFTLIELMVVVAIMGLILAMGIPSFRNMLQKQGMAKAVNDLQQACATARARAIFSGTTTDVVFHPADKRFDVDGGGITAPSMSSGSTASGQLADDIGIEMLDINLLEYKDSEVAKVRFFPNGTSDEMTVILRSSHNEWIKLSLEVTTAIASFGPVDR